MRRHGLLSISPAVEKIITLLSASVQGPLPVLRGSEEEMTVDVEPFQTLLPPEWPVRCPSLGTFVVDVFLAEP